MSAAASSIQVTVRVRPFTIREAAQVTKPDDNPTFFGEGALVSSGPKKLSSKGIRKIIKVLDERVLVFDPPEDNPVARYQKTILPQGKRVKDMRYGFDRIFDETATQQEVYQATSQQLLDSVLDGYNATVFAYGATGCGKTHTISGTPQQPGIIFLTMQELFEKIEEQKETKTIDLTMSYLEIYNETIRDLLVEGGSTQVLHLREDSKQTITVAGLSQHRPKGVHEVMDLIMMGNANRTQSPTEANATSSRSHAVLQICIAQKEKSAGLTETQTSSVLSMIDLAGSERASVTKNRGDRLLEGANINRSLLALGNCINALCENKKGAHVPYRDSKLTRLLKFSLGGNCKTIMIVCVSPSSAHYDETHNTLKYADRAKRIKTKVSRNMIDVNRHVSQYVKAIYDLRQEVDQLKKRLGDSTKEAMEKIKKQSHGRDMAMRDAQKRLKHAYDMSADLRSTKLKDIKDLRLLERNSALLNAWVHAFDEVFESRYDEQPPAALFSIRSAADKVIRENEDKRQMLQEKTANSDDPTKAIETCLENIITQLKKTEGVTDIDIQTIYSEARLYTSMTGQEIYQGLASAEVDITNTVYMLAKAHFEAIATLNTIQNLNMTEEEAIETAKKSLCEVIKACTDATSHIVSPNGELVSAESAYHATVIGTPKRKRRVTSEAGTLTPSNKSPAKLPALHSHIPTLNLSSSNSPARSSPRIIKARSPKKHAVLFPKKKEAKKRVRFQDEEAPDDQPPDSEWNSLQLHEPLPPSLQLDLPAPSLQQQQASWSAPSRPAPGEAPSANFPSAQAPLAPQPDLPAQGQASPVRPSAPRRPAPTTSNTDTSDAPASSAPARSSHLQAGFLKAKSSSQSSQSVDLARALTGGQPLQELGLAPSNLTSSLSGSPSTAMHSDSEAPTRFRRMSTDKVTKSSSKRNSLGISAARARRTSDRHRGSFTHARRPNAGKENGSGSGSSGSGMGGAARHTISLGSGRRVTVSLNDGVLERLMQGTQASVNRERTSAGSTGSASGLRR